MKLRLFIVLMAWQVASAQSFSTRVSPKILGKEDILQVEYVADNVSIDQFNLPRFINWTILSGPNVSNSKVISGSAVKEQTIYSVMLQPQIVGVIIIPGASALINNKPQQSNQVSVQVKNVAHVGGQPSANVQPQTPLFDLLGAREVPTNQSLKKGENAVEKIKSNLFVRVETSRQSCYVGEPIIATYKLCTRLKSKSKVIKQPSFSGCTVMELTNSYQDQHIERINGQDYNVFVVRKLQLTPLDAGLLVLPPTVVENTVSFYPAGDSQRDFFGNRSGPTEDHVVTLQNKPVIVRVLPLPAFAGGGVFSGAVGNFSIDLHPMEPNFTTNGTNHLSLTIEGVGNLQPIELPNINWPKGMEAFEATESQQTDKESNPVTTRKIFSIPFVANKMGNYVLPPFTFTWFDPNARKFITKSTPSFLLRVMPGSKILVTKPSTANNYGNFQQRLFVLLGGGVLAVIIGIAWYSGTRRAKLPPVIAVQQKDSASVIPTMSQSQFLGREFIYRIHQLEPAENTSPFYRELNKNIKSYLLDRFNIQPAAISTLAVNKPFLAEPLNVLKGLMENCTLGMYTPVFSMVEATQHRLLAIETLETMERSVPGMV